MPETPPASPAAPVPAPGSNVAESTETFQIPKAEWEEVKRMASAANSLAAELRIARKQKEAAPAAPAAQQVVVTDDEPTTNRAKIEKLIEEAKAKIAQQERLAQANEKRLRKTGIKEAMTRNGIPEEAQDLLEDHLERRFGDKIRVSDDDKITVTDELEQSKEIGEFISDLLKTPKGKFFKPEKVAGPNTRAGRGTTISLPGQKSFSEMSIDERLKLEKSDRAAYLALAQAAARGGG